MITTRRTAVSDKEFETKTKHRNRNGFKTDAPAYVDPVIKPLRADNPVITRRITPAADKEDLMPTIKREKRAEKQVSAQQEEESASVTVRAVDSRTKAVMITYMAIAFVLAMIVLATGLIITSRATEVAKLESDVRTAYNRILGQEETMDYLSDGDVVNSKASEMGMTGAGAAEEIELIDMADEVTYEERTNGFDRFCDFLSRLIGG